VFRRYWDRPLGSKLILLLSIALLIEMLAPWQRVCAVTSGGGDARVCGWRTAYEGSNWGAYAAILAVAVIVWEVLPILFPRLSMRGWPAAVITAILSVALAVCVLVKLIVDNEFQQIWAWIGLAISLAIMLTALVRARFRWETRHKPGSASVTPQPGAHSGS
jgi:hypothetical protein